jgi:hypothetical protein
MEESMAIKEKDPSTAQLHLNSATGNNCSICVTFNDVKDYLVYL